jgi:hypothetical protein
VAAVEAAASCLTATCTTAALTSTPFGRVDAVVLSRTPVGLELLTQLDAFPQPELVRIVFAEDTFDPSVWARRDWGELVVLVRRP